VTKGKGVRRRKGPKSGFFERETVGSFWEGKEKREVTGSSTGTHTIASAGQGKERESLKVRHNQGEKGHKSEQSKGINAQTDGLIFQSRRQTVDPKHKNLGPILG